MNSNEDDLYTEIPVSTQPLKRSDENSATLLDLLGMLVLIREFERVCEPLSAQGEIPGGCHLAIGQEAVAVGVCSALAREDVIAYGHRGHHFALAKGLDPARAMAELFGKVDGVVQGRGGSMHLSDLTLGLEGGNGIVGAALGIAAGHALASQMKKNSTVAVGVMGDGALNVGRVWESLNLAAVWSLPLVAICENNLYAVETHANRVTAGESAIARAQAFGMAASIVDGQDVLAVRDAVSAARAACLAGDGPVFLEIVTYRYRGHNTGEGTPYRSDEEVREWMNSRDPIVRVRKALVDSGALPPGYFERLVADTRAVIESAVQFARDSAPPDTSLATSGQYQFELRKDVMIP